MARRKNSRLDDLLTYTLIVLVGVAGVWMAWKWVEVSERQAGQEYKALLSDVKR